MATGMTKASNNIYYAQLGTTQTIPNNAKFLTLNIPSGAYIVLVYNSNQSSKPVWLGVDNNPIEDQTSDLYCMVSVVSSGVVYHVFSNASQLSLHNLSGQAVSFTGATRIIAIKL